MRRKYTRYSDELAARICALISGGQSLNALCTGRGMPCAETVRGWTLAHPRFGAGYTAAIAARNLSFAQGQPRSWRAHRHSTYSPRMAQRICRAVEGGASVADLQRRRDLPSYSTLRRWLRTRPAFRQMFEAARQERRRMLSEARR